MYRKLLLIAIATFALNAQTTTATITRDINLPVIGVAPTETLQVNLQNLASASSSGTSASCTGSVSFFGSTGTIIGSATTFTIASGVINPVAAPFSKLGSGTTRVVVRPQIALTTTSGTPCELTYTVETYDTATGVTHVFIGGGSANFFAGPIFGGGGPGGGR
jgi:hypothetical protein